MPTCAGRETICVDDIIDFDDIQEPCVSTQDSHGQELCTSCANIQIIQKANPILFHDNPLNAIFAITKPSPEALDRIWMDLKRACGVQRPTATTSLGPVPVVLPDRTLLNTNIFIIDRRSGNHPLVRKYLVALQEIVKQGEYWNCKQEEDPQCSERRMKQDVLEALQPVKDKIGGSHHPRELPLGIGLFLHTWATASDLGFKQIQRKLLNSSGCIEGVLSIASQAATTAPEALEVSEDTVKPFRNWRSRRTRRSRRSRINRSAPSFRSRRHSLVASSFQSTLGFRLDEQRQRRQRLLSDASWNSVLSAID